MAVEDKDPAAMTAASALYRPPDHGHVYAPALEPVLNGHAGFASEDLFQKRLVPNKNVGLIIAEASCLNAKFVTFPDDDFAELDSKKINRTLTERHLPTVMITSWSDVLQRL
jgi:hypothetical protein